MVNSSTRVSEEARKQENNFDLLRLLFAASVMMVHARTLSNSVQLNLFHHYLDSLLAVQGFFVISGYLITMSCERSPSLWQFAIKRARRLLPAYFTVVLGSAAAGIFLTTYSATEYLASPKLYAYVTANLSFLNFLQPALPGVFSSNPHTAVNGALWSIRSELACYAATPVFVLLVKLIGKWRALTATCFMLASASASLLWIQAETGSQIVGLIKLTFADCGLCFVLGCGAWYFRKMIRTGWFALAGLVAFVLLVTGTHTNAWIDIVYRPTILAVAVMYFGIRFPYLGNWCRYGDLSYGIYIYHFPVVQVLVAGGWFEKSPYLSLATVTGLTLALAYLSWRFIEAPWLRKDSHYILESTSSPR